MSNEIIVTEEGRVEVVIEPEPVIELVVDAAPATDLVVEVPAQASLIIVKEQGPQGPPGGGGGSGDISMADLEAHIDADEPHPIYDDGPSLELLYENAKV